MPEPSFPVVTDEDIVWATEILKLPADAFSPKHDEGARQQVLKATDRTLDVPACPGSGKTTLLVAKLAILAKKWPYRRRGICVLSHTNVAKDEITKRLGNSKVGQALLSHPHFVGTIHGFVNEFLALPSLRALGRPVKMVDDQAVFERRMRLLQAEPFRALKMNVDSKRDPEGFVRDWNIASPDFSVADAKGQPIYKTDGPALRALKKLVQFVANQGYHRYGEMFIWADHLLQADTQLQKVIRHRFPLVYLDEVQDNSEEQSEILHRIFMEGDGPVWRQRFGDADQAIFDTLLAQGATTHPFPAAAGVEVIQLPNSHRFGPSIANLAKPLSFARTELIGQGPTKEPTTEMDDRHAIFLFDDASMHAVLDAYGAYLLDTFECDQATLNGMTFSAVGAVHRNNGDDHKPRHVSHYWPSYDPEISLSEAKPKTFLQYVLVGHRLAARFGTDGTEGEAFAAVEKLAEGILRLVREVVPDIKLHRRRRQHRYLLELLAGHPKEQADYLELVRKFAVERLYPSVDDWNNHWLPAVQSIAGAAAGKMPQADLPFLAYPEHGDERAFFAHAHRQGNVHVVQHNGREVRIRLGSIHSVKGETHTATLILETYTKAHNLKKIIDWLSARKAGNTRNVNERRLKLHYVAMTRPSHLLCLAMKQDALSEKDRQALKNHGWTNIGEVHPDGSCDWS